METRRTEASKYIPALGFRRLTPYYDAVVGYTTRERTFKRALIQQANIEPGQRVLDLACGTGTLSIWIKKSSPEAVVVGVDGDPEVLSLATRKAKQAGVSVQLDEAMSYDLPYPDSHFDRVVSSLFFHHLSWEDKGRTVQEIYRILRPGGQFHVADWGKAENVVMRALFVSIQLLDGFRNTRDNVTGKLVELFEGAGFVEVARKRTFSTLFGTMALYSAVKPG
jgi:ubiquinone/menaquinone biosynthesis C-methylase UbiE